MTVLRDAHLSAVQLLRDKAKRHRKTAVGMEILAKYLEGEEVDIDEIPKEDYDAIWHVISMLPQGDK